MENYSKIVDIQFIKTRANFIRHSFIEEMEKHLLAFENEVVSNNIKIQWIPEEADLVEAVISLLPKSHYNKVCFDLPDIPKALKNDNNVIKEISIDDFQNHIDTADHLVVKADFAIVENGNIVFVNKKSKNCFNQVQNLIIVLDINKLVIRQNDLDILLFLQNSSKSHNFYPEDIKMIAAPMKRIISDSFQSTEQSNFTSENVSITIFLYDNGISTILENNILRDSLYCIDCGKCKTVCPVYNITHRFSPIELIKHNCNEENLSTQQIFSSTTLCGNCNFVCPVLIPFTDLLVYEMEKANLKTSREKNNDLHKIFMKRAKMNKMNGKFYRYFFIKKYYGKNKKLSSYYYSQKEDFFNITKNSQKFTDE